MITVIRYSKKLLKVNCVGKFEFTSLSQIVNTQRIKNVFVFESKIDYDCRHKENNIRKILGII